MDFFERPILNSPYEYPNRHWELDKEGQPTEKLLEHRRRAEFISPIPKAKKKKTKAQQGELDIAGEDVVSDAKQKYDQAIINELRGRVDAWRELKNPNDWGVTPETARLLQHWRSHQFNSIRPFFCQVEAVETAIWLAEVAPTDKNGKKFLEHLKTSCSA
jgi:type III restriction enzyme